MLEGRKTKVSKSGEQMVTHMADTEKDHDRESSSKSWPIPWILALETYWRASMHSMHSMHSMEWHFLIYVSEVLS